ERTATGARRVGVAPFRRPTFVVVEKVLGGRESLISDWPVAGTTGYEFLDWISAVQTDVLGSAALTTAWRELSGVGGSAQDVVMASKRSVMDHLFGSEVGAFGLRLQRLARQDRRGRDLTLRDLTSAIVETTAALSVYRTYVRSVEV